MFNAQINNVLEWKIVLGIIDRIVDEAMFICREDGISFRGMDSSHIALLDVFIPKSSFDKYEFETKFFGLRINDFKNIIHTADDSDVIDLQMEKPGTLTIVVNGALKTIYAIGLLDKSLVNIPVPRMDFETEFTISTSMLVKIISNVETVSEYVKLNSLPHKIQFSSKGDVSSVEVYLDSTNKDLISLKSNKDTFGVYGTEYIKKIIHDVSNVCQNCTIRYGDDTPLYILIELPSSIKMECYLAPKNN